MKNISDYIGIPWIIGGSDFSGCDCWGLSLLILDECFNIQVNRFIGAKYTGDELDDIINSEASSPDWQLSESPKNGDLCVMSCGEKLRAEHIGVYVDGLIVHALGKNGQGASTANKPAALKKIFKKMEYYRFVGNNNCS